MIPTTAPAGSMTPRLVLRSEDKLAPIRAASASALLRRAARGGLPHRCGKERIHRLLPGVRDWDATLLGFHFCCATRTQFLLVCALS